MPGTSPDEIRRINDDIIDQMDSNGGHIQEKHVGKSNEFLLQRAIHEGDATSFPNKRTATTAIKENILRNVNRISDWLRVSDKMCISLKLPSGIISNPRKPGKAGRLTWTGFRGFKDGF